MDDGWIRKTRKDILKYCTLRHYADGTGHRFLKPLQRISAGMEENEKQLKRESTSQPQSRSDAWSCILKWLATSHNNFITQNTWRGWRCGGSRYGVTRYGVVQTVRYAKRRESGPKSCDFCVTFTCSSLWEGSETKSLRETTACRHEAYDCRMSRITRPLVAQRK